MSLDPITAGLDLVKGVIGIIWPDPAKKAEAEARLLELQLNGQLQKMMAEYDIVKGQLSVNTEEAKHENIFVSGWRPFIGWVCGASYAYHFIFQPCISFLCSITGKSVAIPVFDMEALSTVLFGMLGLGIYRTAEKVTDKIVNRP